MKTSDKLKFLLDYKDDLYWANYYMKKCFDRNKIIGICKKDSQIKFIINLIDQIMEEYELFCEKELAPISYPNELLTYDSEDQIKGL
jgi:hypothetical protein